MHAILITMSPKRLAQIQEDPETLADVIEARHETEIPGLLDLGTAWNALDALLSEGGKDTILGDAVLARSGEIDDGHRDVGGEHGHAVSHTWQCSR